MKRKMNIVFLLVLCISITGCEKKLDEIPSKFQGLYDGGTTGKQQRINSLKTLEQHIIFKIEPNKFTTVPCDLDEFTTDYSECKFDKWTYTNNIDNIKLLEDGVSVSFDITLDDGLEYSCEAKKKVSADSIKCIDENGNTKSISRFID